jgi:signal transduction histidine kinase
MVIPTRLAPARDADAEGADARRAGDAATRRAGFLRWAIAAGPVIALLILTLEYGRRETPGSEIPTLLLVVLPLLLRNAWPGPTLVVVAVGATLTAATFQEPWVQLLAVALAAFDVGLRVADRTRSMLHAVGVGALILGGVLAQGADPVEALVLVFVVLVPSWVIGDTIRTRRLEATRRSEDAARALREREERLLAAAAQERRHVARELHDVIAHGVSVMVVQAGAARQVMHTSPEAAEESLHAVEATGREAMAELRRFVGALGDDAGDGGLAPQPGIAEIGALVDRVREAGLPVTLEVVGEPAPLPASLDVTVYRVAQEALTNALRYAGRAATSVRLAWVGDGLRLEILDEGPGAAAPRTEGAGRGLAGMRDRIELAGGHLAAGPRLGGGFGVRAWLPTPAGRGPAPVDIDAPEAPALPPTEP